MIHTISHAWRQALSPPLTTPKPVKMELGESEVEDSCSPVVSIEGMYTAAFPDHSRVKHFLQNRKPSQLCWVSGLQTKFKPAGFYWELLCTSKPSGETEANVCLHWNGLCLQGIPHPYASSLEGVLNFGMSWRNLPGDFLESLIGILASEGGWCNQIRCRSSERS